MVLKENFAREVFKREGSQRMVPERGISLRGS
jgi:hypothetical protein